VIWKALIGVCLVLAGLLWFQTYQLNGAREDNARLRANVAVLQQRAEDAELAQDVAEAYRRGAEDAARKLSVQIETALTQDFGGCADEAIDPDLLRALGRG